MDKLKAYLTGRAKRSEFWIWTIASLVVTIIGTAFVYRNSVFWSVVSFLPWAIYGSRRLRDFGASPWWVLFPICNGFVVGFVVGFVNVATPGGPAIPPALQTLIIGVLSWGFIIYIGSRKSTPPASPELALQA